MARNGLGINAPSSPRVRFRTPSSSGIHGQTFRTQQNQEYSILMPPEQSPTQRPTMTMAWDNSNPNAHADPAIDLAFDNSFATASFRRSLNDHEDISVAPNGAMPMHLPPPTPHMNDDISLPPHSDTLSPLQSVQNNRYTRARVFSNPQFPSQRSENTRPMSSTTLSPLHSVQNNGYTRARAFSSPRFSPQRSENTRPMSSAVQDSPIRRPLFQNNTAPLPSEPRSAHPEPQPTSDPDTERARERIRQCLNLTHVISTRLSACEPLLLVTQTRESSDALAEIFGLLEQSLVQPTDHVCEQPYCSQARWHDRHARKLQELTQRLDRFHNDFDHPRRKISALARKLERYLSDFRQLEAGVRRLWVRLERSTIETCMERSHLAIKTAEAQLDRMRREYEHLRRLRAAEIGRFNAVSARG